MKAFFDLTKLGIIIFVVASGLAGFGVSFPVGQPLEMWQPLLLIFGLALVSGGSFAINQAQEWHIDQKMARTKNRPIPRGTFRPWQGYAIGGVMAIFGVLLLFVLSPLSGELALLTVFLYNITYTILWKRKSPFAAIPGAIPGAMPAVIGYSANSGIFTAECVYLFLIMFLWQMPHFWCLAIRYKDDYARGGIPVLPLAIGTAGTLYYLGLYFFAYVGLAVAAPLFVDVHLVYLVTVIPISIKIVYEFVKYLRIEHSEPKAWLPFFLWVNLSMLIFLTAPVLDKLIIYYWM